MEIETIMKLQGKPEVEDGNLGKRSEITDVSIINRMQKIEQRISGIEDTIEDIHTTVKENIKCKKLLIQNIQEGQETMRRSNLRKIGRE